MKSLIIHNVLFVFFLTLLLVNNAFANWDVVGGTGFSDDFIYGPDIAISNSVPYVTFSDNCKGYVMKFDGHNWIPVGQDVFIFGKIIHPNITFSGSVPYVAYAAASSGKANVTKFDGNNWVQIGGADFSPGSGIAAYTRIAFGNNCPYVAFANYHDGVFGKANVMKFVDDSWVQVGNADFSPSGAEYLNLAFVNTTPYVAYRDASKDGKVSVMKFDGNSWVQVGNAGFSSSGIYDLSFAVADTTPYVAFRDTSQSEKVSVMKFDGNSWVQVGNAGFSTGAAYYVSIAITNAIPYVAFADQDPSKNGKVSVMKFDGNNWIQVGSAGFSAGRAYYTKLTFNGTTPYVAFSDGTEGGKISVMKFSDSQISSSPPVLSWMPLLLSNQLKFINIPMVYLDQSFDQNNYQLLSEDSLDTESAKVVYVDHPDAVFTFSLESGPTGLSLDENTGAVTYQAPIVTAHENYQFTFSISTGEESWNYEGQISISPASNTIFTATGQAETYTSDSGETEIVAEAGQVPDQTGIVISEGYDSDGNSITRISFNPTLPDNHQVTININESSAKRLKTSSVKKSSGDNFCETYAGVLWDQWDQTEAKFFHGFYRFRNDSGLLVRAAMLSPSGWIHVKKHVSSVLCSPKSHDDSSIEEYTPVIFINGYTFGNMMGGGEGTWKEMFNRLPSQIAGNKILPIEFRWRTNTRFEDAADDLAKAVNFAYSTTGKKVHIVAHSFGGILARTYLQGVQYTPGSRPVASLVTVGSPQSGIFDSDTIEHPDGTDGWLGNIGIDACGQISCYQAGEGTINPNILALVHDAEKGELIRAIDDPLNSFPTDNFPVNVLIGVRQSNNCAGDNTFRKGDGLISFEGQRFHQTDKKSTPLRRNAYIPFMRARVTEQIIAHPTIIDANVPGSTVPTPGISNGWHTYGYGHTYAHRTSGICGTGGDHAKYTEVGVEGYEHATLNAIVSWLEGVVPPITEPGIVVSAGQTWMDRNLGAARVATSPTDEQAYGDLYQWGRGTDGHEKRNSPNTTVNSTTDSPGHGQFIIEIGAPWDWRIPQNNNLWQGVSGLNNPCPAGFRLPTAAELEIERTSWNSNDAAGAFASPLKLVVAGRRSMHDGTLGGVGAGGFGEYWSSTTEGIYSYKLFFHYDGSVQEGVVEKYNRALGFSIRCIKE